MATSGFYALPEELIVQILAELELQDILRCSHTCRLFYFTIKYAVALQYDRHLTVTGMQDCGSASRLPIAERLEEIKAQQEGWTNLRFRARYQFPMPQYCRVWELCGGVMSHGLPKGLTTRGLAFIEFPSTSRRVPGRVWEHPDLGIDIRDFTFDSAQDLMVVVAAKSPASAQENWEREIYLFSMNTGRNHPMAASVPLKCSLNRATDKDGDFVLQIMANFVAVLFHARDVDCKDQLFIWNWKTGQIVTNHMFQDMLNQMDAFAFLSPRHFVVSKIEPTPFAADPPELQVYDFLDTDPRWPTRPRLMRAFQLPQPVEGAIVAAMTIRSDPAPRDSSPMSHLDEAPFRTGPSSHLLVISIVIFHPIPEGDFIRNSFQLFVNGSTLLQGLRLSEGSALIEVVSWREWGPQNSRLLNSVSMEFTWVCYVHGTRFITLDHGGSVERKSRLNMLDFSPWLVKQTQHAQILRGEDAPAVRESDDPRDGASPRTLERAECRIISASEPTVVRSGHAFEDTIVTSLPYRDICSSELFDYRAVMIDEECLVGIRAPLEEGRRVIEVLCF